MPCDDITEIIELHVTDDNRLRSYTLNKRTCGADIGQASLLAPWLAGHTVDQVLAVDGVAVRNHYPQMQEAEEFLYFKHVVALQEALAVLCGRAPGDPNSACATLAVWPHEAGDGIIFRGLVSVAGLADEIEACGNCSGCGSRRRGRGRDEAANN